MLWRQEEDEGMSDEQLGGFRWTEEEKGKKDDEVEEMREWER